MKNQQGLNLVLDIYLKNMLRMNSAYLNFSASTGSMDCTIIVGRTKNINIRIKNKIFNESIGKMERSTGAYER